MTQSNGEAEVTHTTELKIKASLYNNGIFVSSSEGIESLSMRGYGVFEGKKLTLAFYEALFLLSKAIIQIEDKKMNEVNFEDLLQSFESVDQNAWVRYLIYRDLRSRGYVVREGFGLGIDFRVYERGEYGEKTAKYLTFGIQEGNPVSIEELAQALAYVQSLKKKMMLAVINRRGEVVYYSLSQLTLR